MTTKPGLPDVRLHRGCGDLGSHRLVEALAPCRRHLYGLWLEKDTAGSSTALSAAQKPFKIPARQLTTRGYCGAECLRFIGIGDPPPSASGRRAGFGSGLWFHLDRNLRPR